MPAPVVEAVLGESQDPAVREAMLVGSYLEGGWWPPFPPGDLGTSFGPYQIHLPAHPGVTRAQAEDPVWATDWIWSDYVSSVIRVDPRLWVSDPAHASAKAAYFAEQPKEMYPESRIQSAWAATVKALEDAGAPLGVGGEGAPSTTPPGTTGPQPGGGAGSSNCASNQVIDILWQFEQKKISQQECESRLQALGCTMGCGGAADVQVGGSHGLGNLLGLACDVPGVSVACHVFQFLFSYRFLEIVGGGLLILLGVSLLGKQLASNITS